MPQVAQLRMHSGVFSQVKVQVQGQFQGKHGYEHYSSIVAEVLNRWREVIGIAIVDCGRNNVESEGWSCPEKRTREGDVVIWQWSECAFCKRHGPRGQKHAM
jgi:hypothetical protein